MPSPQIVGFLCDTFKDAAESLNLIANSMAKIAQMEQTSKEPSVDISTLEYQKTIESIVKYCQRVRSDFVISDISDVLVRPNKRVQLGLTTDGTLAYNITRITITMPYTVAVDYVLELWCKTNHKQFIRKDQNERSRVN